MPCIPTSQASPPRPRSWASSIAAAACCLAACRVLAADGPANPHAVSFWNEIGAASVNTRYEAARTAEEARPAYQLDLATMNLAMHDALSAIEGRYPPFAVKPAAPAAGASLEAAADAAAYGVLQALFPSRSAVHRAAFDQRVAALPDGPARAAGLALGHEVAAAWVALRANDGRSTALAPYVSGTAPGQFRSVNAEPLNRYLLHVRPFALLQAQQFRPAGPPALDSAAYATDLEESRQRGGASSATRSAQDLEAARFHTEPPGPFLARNFGRLAGSTADIVDAARLMAMVYVTHADAITACFEAKYHHQAWRPRSAIPLSGAAGQDRSWTPVLPTPNHPEYPAAHSCTAGALAETLRSWRGAQPVKLSFDSLATGTTRHYASPEAFEAESTAARIDGGMHFRHSTVDGLVLGRQVARWVLDRSFPSRP